MSAEDGDAGAQFAVAYMYDLGRSIDKDGYGIQEDNREATKWYRKAANHGISSAQYNLAWMYVKGESVTEDFEEAAKWFRKSNRRDGAEDIYKIGQAYGAGLDVAQDSEEAAEWFRLATKQGHEYSKAYLQAIFKPLMDTKH